jgi:hypothetical protein
MAITLTGSATKIVEKVNNKMQKTANIFLVFIGNLLHY